MNSGARHVPRGLGMPQGPILGRAARSTGIPHIGCRPWYGMMPHHAELVFFCLMENILRSTCAFILRTQSVSLKEERADEL